MRFLSGLPWWVGVVVLVLSAGVRARAAEVDLVSATAGWRRLPGIAEASTPDTTAWRLPGFSDAAWAAGMLPLFYGEDLSGSRVTGMQNSYLSYFVRTRFTLSTPADVRNLVLHAACDDGFVAWVNGVEVARYNMPQGPLGLASSALSAAPEPVAELDYPMAGIGPALRTGENVLAVQVFNVNLTSSDLVFRARLTADVDEEPPVVDLILPEPGAVVQDLRSIEVQFSEAVTGVEAADLLVNGVGATGVQLMSPGQYVFTVSPSAAGPVAVRFREGHGIRDLSSAGRALVTRTWSYTVDPTAVVTLRINEFLADNDSGIRDEDGRRSDWIEIHNPGTQSISLLGWSLTDDAGRPRKWSFPALAIPARGYTLVWASGNDRTNPAAPLHTNFRLAEGGEFLGLVSPSGAMVSAFSPSYPNQRSDVAYGRLPGSPDNGFLPTPTPRAANAAGGPGFAPDIQATPASGTYIRPTTLNLDPSTNAGPAGVGTVIRYTLDGTLPRETSPVWNRPLALSNQAVQVRARAYTPGLLPGRPTTQVLLPLATAVSRFTSDLPVVVIHNFNRGRPPANERVPAFFQVFEPGTNGITVLTNAPVMTSRAGISVRGSSTEGMPKASLRVEFRDEFDEDRRVSFLGMPEEGDWVMYGPNSFEPVLIHNPFMHDLSRAIGRYSPRTRFCEVYLVTSGTNQVQSTSYNGVYVAMDRIEVGGDRVDLGSLEPENLTEPSITGGYLMKVDRLDPGDSGISAAGLTIGLVEPKESELEEPARAPQMSYLRRYLNDFSTALNGVGYANPVTGYRAYVDVPSWIDHHLLNTFAFNVDALRLSAYFGKRREGKLEFGPLWDFDRSLGSTDGRDSDPRTWMSQFGDRGTDFFNYPWWGRMFTDLEFFQAYVDRYHELRSGLMSDAELALRVDGLASQVRLAAVRDWARWGGSPRASTYQGEVNLMKTWIRARTGFMDSQFVRPAALATTPGTVVRGSTVRLTVPAGTTVYYTTNGTDPRLIGGGISTLARAYVSPIPIQANTRIRARAHNANHTALTGAGNPPLISRWSGEVRGTYVTDPLPIEVTEIHFDPVDGPDAGAEDFEFVELSNRGSQPIDLNGVRLEGAVEFAVTATNALRTLAAGGRAVVVSDRVAFAQRYPGVTQVLGEFSGRLANEGETLRIIGPLQEVVLAIPYSPAWLGTLAEPGRSLVPVREGRTPEEAGIATNWVASWAVSGSPGKVDAASLPPARELRATLEAGEVVLKIAMETGVAVEIQGRSVVGSGLWERAAVFPAGLAREERLAFLPSQAARFYRAISVVE
jgi:CotH kinase protein/Lamin Tail Domain/Fn3 associated/Chitobiase/beta-hexosaminidase C-terminal domain